MREILFRGKSTTTGKWHEGSLLKVTLDGTTYSLIFGDNFLRVGMGVEALQHSCVYPETVGQFTGLLDKNGKKIFEGDVVEGPDFTPEDDGYGVVYYKDGSFWVEGNSLTGTFSENYWSHSLEVIDNIHDNQELLKGE